MDVVLNKETRSFLEDLKRRTDVIGIILFGSWARGNHRPDSDVDLLVILTNGFKRAVEYHDNQAFEIIYTTGKSALEFWENSRDECARFWEIAKILFDKDGSIQQLRVQAAQITQAGKPPLDQDQLARFQFDAEDQLRYIESILASDLTTANMLLSNKVFLLTELFFDVRQIWTPAPKQSLLEIKILSPAFYGLLEQFYSDTLTINEKLTITRQMIPIVINPLA